MTCGQCEQGFQLAWTLEELYVGGSLLGKKSSGNQGDHSLPWILQVTDPS